MERVARLITKDKNSRQFFAIEDVARGVWASVVGKTIARHCGNLRVVRASLVVDVEDAVWQRQLSSLSGQILHRLQKMMGSTAISELEFRVGVPKRQPQREESLRRTDMQGDGEAGIADPVLKRIYQLSKKRSSA